MYFFELYHEQSKHSKEKVPHRTPASAWPPEWKTIYLKDYPRFPKNSLVKPTELTQTLSDTLLQRKTIRVFDSHITAEKLSSLLYWGIAEKPESDHRMYPSAGARYPLEFYLCLTHEVADLPAGVYHYNASRHNLIKINTMPTDLSTLSIDDSFLKAQFTLITTATFARSSLKYGERAYRFCLLEAGAATQNLSLVATALGLGSMHLGGAIDTEIEQLLAIDGHEESVVSVVCFG